MALIDNREIIKKIMREWDGIRDCFKEPLVWEPFLKDFCYRFCWNSNSIEGSTLSLDETVSIIEYDEVRSGHTYTEYTEALNLYRAIREMLDFNKMKITEDWIKEVNGIVMGTSGEYRANDLYVGTIFEAVYYPPKHEHVHDLMREYVQALTQEWKSPETVFEEIAEAHICFERIHPFKDGNGRTGRMILNQSLINAGWLPVIMENQSKYRQSFRRYEATGDTSMLTHLICKGELAAMERIKTLQAKACQSESPANILKKDKRIPAPRL